MNVYMEIYHKATVGSFILLSHSISTSVVKMQRKEGKADLISLEQNGKVAVLIMKPPPRLYILVQ